MGRREARSFSAAFRFLCWQQPRCPALITAVHHCNHTTAVSATTTLLPELIIYYYHLHYSITTMKIQSSLLILAAMVGSATAANKRKRVFKIYSREEIRAAEEATRSLQKQDKPAKNEKPVMEADAVPAVQSMSMTLSPSGAPVVLETIDTPATAMSMMTKCTFCDGMEFDPDYDLGVQGQTCGTVHAAATKLDATDENCSKAKVAETVCCPPELVLTPPVMSMPITTAATTVPATEGVPATLPEEEGGDKGAPVQGVPSG